MNNLPIVVCELGINPGGQFPIAEAIINEIGAIQQRIDYPENSIFFKFQKRNPREAVPEHMWNKLRISPISGKETTYIEYKEEIEFDLGDYTKINNLTHRWFVSVWDLSSVNFIVSNFPNVPFIKIPSPHLVNDNLIESCVSTDIPLIISTGMSTEFEIDHAISLIPRGYPLTILACVSVYPAWDEFCHLNKINLLRTKYAYRRESTNFGYSGHSPSHYPSIYAGLLGAEMIEVHCTLNRSLPGSDNAASIEMRGIELILRELKRMPGLLGPDQITVFPEEMKKRDSLRIVA
jgi:N-acetylneuraminate synthase